MMLNCSAFQSKVDRLRLPWWSFDSNVLNHRSGQPFIYFLLTHGVNQEDDFSWLIGFTNGPEISGHITTADQWFPVSLEIYEMRYELFESFFTRKRSDSLLACAADSLNRGFCDTSGFQFFGCCFTRNSESWKNRMLSQANAANEGNISTREEKFSISKRPCNFLLNPHAT